MPNATLGVWAASPASATPEVPTATVVRPSRRVRPMIGGSEALQSLLQRIRKLHGHDVSILIQGETGTGKELVARAIHAGEGDPTRPFVVLNCAEVPEQLLESEWFGHEKGAFTGADRAKPGRFELANGGDLFLDEISTLSLHQQAKLLRVLQEKEISRVGSTHSIALRFRLIAATNDNLYDLVQQGKFRADLYQRLVMLRMTVPPLRERPGDIPLLVAHFLQQYGGPDAERALTADALRFLQRHPWPGNIRELENMTRAILVLFPESPTIDVAQIRATLPDVLDQHAHHADIAAAALSADDAGDGTMPLKHYIRKIERSYIEHVIQQQNGNKDAAALALQVGRTTLYAKLREYGIE